EKQLASVDVDSGTLQVPSQAFGGCAGFGCVGARQEYREFLASDAAQDLTFGERLAHQRDDQPQRLVAAGVPELVVDELEMIDIDGEQRQRPPLARGGGDDLFCAILEGAPVEHAG